MVTTKKQTNKSRKKAGKAEPVHDFLSRAESIAAGKALRSPFTFPRGSAGLMAENQGQRGYHFFGRQSRDMKFSIPLEEDL